VDAVRFATVPAAAAVPACTCRAAVAAVNAIDRVAQHVGRRRAIDSNAVGLAAAPAVPAVPTSAGSAAVAAEHAVLVFVLSAISGCTAQTTGPARSAATTADVVDVVFFH
jgi:hypothetical protein